MPGSNEYSRSPFLQEGVSSNTNISINESNDGPKETKTKLKPKSTKPKWSMTNAVISDGAQTYKVKAGNTLGQIVAAYNKKNNTNLKWQDVAKWSSIADPTKMQIGHLIQFVDPNTNQDTNRVENVISEVPAVVTTADSTRTVTPDSVQTVIPDSTRAVVTPDSTQITVSDSARVVTPDSTRVATPDSTQIVLPTNEIQDWIKTMKRKGYIQGTVEGGSIAFSDGKGNTFYDNGRMKAKGATNNIDYNYKDLKPLAYMLEKRKKIWNTANPEPKGITINSEWEPWWEKFNAAINAGNNMEEWLNEYPEPTYKINNPEWLKWYIKKQHAEQTGWYKNGGNMTKKYQQGGAASQQDMQQQIIALVQAAMQGNQKATQQITQIMEAAKAGNQQAVQIAQMIQQVMQQMQGQATTAKWGAKLRYIKSLKYAKGGKACPTCMSEGGQAPKNKNSKVKVAYKDIDGKTYENVRNTRELMDDGTLANMDLHSQTYAKSYNKDRSYNISHKPTASDSVMLDKKILSPALRKKYSVKNECGGKAKKHYFGGWL